MPNRLGAEKSPYLLQHAGNPVDWYPWGDEAFTRARAEQKPIFLSIGYSTCHWCHVMERESFESDEVARVMNEHFVNVKVDREERPDVDRVYMAFVQATTGGGGWPMSVFLTPELEPFFGGTYFPPDNRYGRPGFKDLLLRVAELWRDKRASLKDAGQRVIAQMNDLDRRGDAVPVGEEAARKGAAFFGQAFDREHAGFGSAPKFPRPAVHDFLLRWFAQSGEDAAAQMVLATLHLMSRGGMYDQLGGGFHRYSVDRFWHVPHFEKMLYDQAQLVDSLVEGWQISGDEQLRRVARETCDYVLRELTQPDGGFSSAEDADSLEPGAAEGSHKLEGAFYVWRAEELEAVVGPEAAPLVSTYYAVEKEGNADDPHGELTGKNVLHVVSTVEEVAKKHGREPADVARLLDEARTKLFAARALRPRPYLDDKVLTSWNGMMIGALARAAMAFGEPRYRDAAERAAAFVTTRLWDGERLLRRWRAGDAAQEAFLDDHAMLGTGLIDLYEATLDERWLDLAEALAGRMVALFHDPKDGGFFTTSGKDASVLLRLKDDYDGAEPAGASVAAILLLRLAELRGRPEWRALAEGTIAFYSSRLRDTPHAMPKMLVAAGLAARPAIQIVVAGEKEDPAVGALLRVVHERFLPERTLLLADEATRSRLGERLPWVAGMGPVEGKAAVYVCKDHACERPTADPAELAALLPKAGV